MTSMPVSSNSSGSPPIPVLDLNRLRAFQRQAEWLRRSKLFENGRTHFKFNVKYSFETKSMTRSFEGYETEQFLAVLPVLRQFILNREPVHFYSIHNIIMQYCDNRKIRKWVCYAREEWKETLANLPSSNLIFFSPVGSVEDAIQEMFYGFGGLFHVDLTKPALDEQKKLVMMAVLQKAFARLWNAIHNIDCSIHIWLDDPDTLIPSFKEAEEEP